MNLDPSPEFMARVQEALGLARVYPDDAVRYMADSIPIWAQARNTPEQAKAARVPGRTLLGLWAPEWPGHSYSPHGIIWLFEYGIKAQGGNITETILDALFHEFGHALQKDHVLDAMERQRPRATVLEGRCCV